MTNTYHVDYEITPPPGRGAIISATCSVDADDEAEALRLAYERSSRLWEEAGPCKLTRIRIFGQGYRESRAVIDGKVVA